jgi:hypothetical protein
LWNRVLTDHSRSIDRLVVWRGDSELDAITDRFFELVARDGDVRVFAHREKPLQ